MGNVIILGSQWGDEGKGKIVDLFAERFDIVARYQGGHNAGHTVFIGDKKFVLKLIPSSILRPGKQAVIGNGLVIDPAALLSEIESLQSAGVAVTANLFISNRAHVLFPAHRMMEKMSEGSLTRSKEPQGDRLSKDVTIANGDAPAAGFQKSAAGDSPQPDFLFSLSAAPQEAQMLYELTQDLGNSLNLHETLSVLDSRLRRLIPYDAIAVYVRQEDELLPQYVNGENLRLFSALRIPVGQGLSGWVADAGKPIINGNPSVEPGYLNDPSKFSTLRSALAVPLENAVGVTGVLTLYHLGSDAFTQDHLRVLLALKSKVSLTIENALEFQQVAISATTDGLTALPNARSLFLHLDGELARCQRTNAELAVLVCDLDGFKQVNDRFGHLEGNKVLKLVAAGQVDVVAGT